MIKYRKIVEFQSSTQLMQPYITIAVVIHELFLLYSVTVASVILSAQVMGGNNSTDVQSVLSTDPVEMNFTMKVIFAGVLLIIQFITTYGI